VDRRKSRVARACGVPALAFEVVKEAADQVGVDLLDAEP
jgi:hypothetical protein